MLVQSVVDQVRMRHSAFSEPNVNEGVIVGVIDTRQRTLLLQYGGTMDGLVSTSVQIAASFSGILIGQSGGVPVYGTTYADGWPIHLDANGVPYVDFTETPIAGDPFGAHGGTPGFPLPTDFLKLINVLCVLTDSTMKPIDIVREDERLDRSRIAMPTAFISGNRLVPVRPLAANNANDIWSVGITAVQLSYIALPVLAALSDVLMLPSVLMESLIAGVAESLSMMVPGISAADKSVLAGAARRAEDAIGSYSMDVVGAATTNRVRYRG